MGIGASQPQVAVNMHDISRYDLTIGRFRIGLTMRNGSSKVRWSPFWRVWRAMRCHAMLVLCCCGLWVGVLVVVVGVVFGGGWWV